MTRLEARLRVPAVVGLLLLLAACGVRSTGADEPIDLGPPTPVAEGVDLFHLADASLLDPPGPVSVHVLRIDTARARLETALARDEVMGREPVAEIARRHDAVAAINAGYFLESGDPDGILKIGGVLVSHQTRPRGAVALLDGGPEGRQAFVFDQVTLSATLAFEVDEERHTVPIAGLDTTRLRDHLMLFTERYHEHTDTAPAGTEWVVEGEPLRVTARHDGRGKTRIPVGGVVLSFGGTPPASPLDRLVPGLPVTVQYRFEPVRGTDPDLWARAPQIVGGAGLLVREGRPLEDWSVERFREGFTTERHPRTMIGVGSDGRAWLIAVDGRQRDVSLGMRFGELRRLALGLGLTDALNLDGGGSTTMVAGGRIVNSPSDAEGPRPVSDALIVVAR